MHSKKWEKTKTYLEILGKQSLSFSHLQKKIKKSTDIFTSMKKERKLLACYGIQERTKAKNYNSIM